MRKLITTVLALLIVVSLIFTSCADETQDVLALLRSNKNEGQEPRIFRAWRKILVKTLSEEIVFPEWGAATTYISKFATRDELTPKEKVFDQSISAYEKMFMLAMTNTTFDEETGKKLIGLFQAMIKRYPRKAENLYIPEEGKEDAYIPVLMKQAMEMLGWSYAPEMLEFEIPSEQPGVEPEIVTIKLYSILDENGETVITARQALTTLPATMLMKHVPVEKQKETADALMRTINASPGAIDWAVVATKDDAFLQQLAMEDYAGPRYTEEEIANAQNSWLNLIRVCEDYDAQPSAEGSNRVRDALYALSPVLRPEVNQEPEGFISLRFTGEGGDGTGTTDPNATATINPNATKTPTSAAEIPAGYTGSRVVWVSKKSFTIAVLKRDSSGNYSVERTFPTGIARGGRTRSGNYKINSKDRWHSWSGSSYSPYTTRQSGGSFIHGPIYTAKNSYSMVKGSYNEIGRYCGSGCLRTTCEAAAYIYGKCSKGTAVIIANDSKYKSKKPSKIPADQRYDPTDPNLTQIPITSFTVDPASVTLKTGEKQKLTIKSKQPSSTTTKAFLYSSDDTKVATVSEAGEITAVAEGKTTIKVQADDKGKVARLVQVTVSNSGSTNTDVALTSFALTPSPLKLAVNETKTLKITSQSPSDYTTKNFRYTCDPAGVVTVNGAESVPSGGESVTVKGLKAGTCKITVKARDTKGHTETVSVEVTDPNVPTYVVDASSPVETIKDLQEKLKVLGLLQAPDLDPDGTYGDFTKAAVNNFQTTYNAENPTAELANTNGFVDQATWDALLGKYNVVPVVDDDHQDAEKISEVQGMLKDLELLSEGSYTDGTYDQATKDAITAFQNDVNTKESESNDGKPVLEENGKVNGATYDKLKYYHYLKMNPPQTPTEDGNTSGEASTQSGGGIKTADVLDESADPEAIKLLQDMLVELELLDEAQADGTYNDATRAAVTGFQNSVNERYGLETLKVTGVVDIATWSKLEAYLSEARKPAQPEEHDGAAESDDSGSAPAPVDDAEVIVVDEDSEPEKIQLLQDCLIVLKLLDEQIVEGEDYGVYTDETRDSVADFQNLVNTDEGAEILKVTGVVNKATWDKLKEYVEEALKDAGDSPTLPIPEDIPADKEPEATIDDEPMADEPDPAADEPVDVDGAAEPDKDDQETNDGTGVTNAVLDGDSKDDKPAEPAADEPKAAGEKAEEDKVDKAEAPKSSDSTESSAAKAEASVAKESKPAEESESGEKAEAPKAVEKSEAPKAEEKKEAPKAEEKKESPKPAEKKEAAKAEEKHESEAPEESSDVDDSET